MEITRPGLRPSRSCTPVIHDSAAVLEVCSRPLCDVSKCGIWSYIRRNNIIVDNYLDLHQPARVISSPVTQHSHSHSHPPIIMLLLKRLHHVTRCYYLCNTGVTTRYSNGIPQHISFPPLTEEPITRSSVISHQTSK